MSVYHPKGSPFYDFQFRGSRFCGSTGRTSRREAEAVERAERERGRALLKRSLANAADLLIGGVCALFPRGGTTPGLRR
jgi:hypothetical protein